MKYYSICDGIGVYKYIYIYIYIYIYVSVCVSIARRFEDNGLQNLEAKVTGSVSVASNRKRGQGTSWTVEHAEEEEE
jgi:hypothetical protein